MLTYLFVVVVAVVCARLGERREGGRGEDEGGERREAAMVLRAPHLKKGPAMAGSSSSSPGASPISAASLMAAPLMARTAKTPKTRQPLVLVVSGRRGVCCPPPPVFWWLARMAKRGETRDGRALGALDTATASVLILPKASMMMLLLLLWWWWWW